MFSLYSALTTGLLWDGDKGRLPDKIAGSAQAVLDATKERLEAVHLEDEQYVAVVNNLSTSYDWVSIS